MLFSSTQTIGSGTFGNIIALETPEGNIPLCIKQVDYLKANISSAQAKKEADSWKLLNHPNIVKLYAWYFDGPFF